MTDIEAKNAMSAAEKPNFPWLNSIPVPATIFMTSFSDVP